LADKPADSNGSKDLVRKARNTITRIRVDSEARLLKDAYDNYGNLLLKAGEQLSRECEVEWLNRPDVKFAGDSLKIGHLIKKPCQSDRPTTNASTNNVNTSGASLGPAAKMRERREKAKVLRASAVESISSVFSRIAVDGRVERDFVKETVTPMIDSLIEDSRALLSLVHLKSADNYTFTHSVNVCILTVSLAMHVGRQDDLEDIGIGALLHDLGKVGTPLEILHKNGPLTEREMAKIREHPLLGASLLAKSGGFSQASLSCVLDHHENLLGTGYPRSRNGNDLSLFALMTSIADVYDALTTDRSYRQALDARTALTIMSERMSGALHPVLLTKFISLVGYYPVGCKIELNNGYIATVLSNDPLNPAKPALVELVADSSGNPLPENPIIDLRITTKLDVKEKEAEEIARSLTPTVMREFREFNSFA